MPPSDRDLEIKIRGHAELFDIPEQAVIATTLDGRIVYWSTGARELFGWQDAEALGRDVIDLTPSTTSRGDAERIMAALRMGRTWTGEFMVRDRGGREFRAHVQDVPVRDEFGELIGIVGISKRSEASR